MTDESRPPEHDVRGLSQHELDEPVAWTLARVSWNGPILDPDQLTAAEFLAALP